MSKDPKIGTGRKPKNTGRRLYTDENPKDTVSIKYATVKDAEDTVKKVKRIKKPLSLIHISEPTSINCKKGKRVP